jgi:hypothetical protein
MIQKNFLGQRSLLGPWVPIIHGSLPIRDPTLRLILIRLRAIHQRGGNPFSLSLRGTVKTWGWLRGGRDRFRGKAAVKDGGPHLQHAVSPSGRPAHLVAPVEPGVDQPVDRAFGARRRDRLAGALALAVGDQRLPIVPDVAF